ncbi:MAG TPA: hypothetical protein VF056_12635, partial [Thermoleophilaceae bacterium]
GGAPDAIRSPGSDHRGMSPAEPVTALVELVLEPDGVRGVLRAQHTPDLPFSGWLGLAVAVDQCRRAADAPGAIGSTPGGSQ